MNKLHFSAITAILLLLLITEIPGINFQIEKVDDFSIVNRRIGTNRTKNIIIEYPYLYTLTLYGLEIYLIEDGGSLNLLSRKPIIEGWCLEKIDNYIFVGTGKDQYDPFNAKIHKIAVSNPDEPTIVQSLDLGSTVSRVWYLTRIENLLLVETDNYSYFNPLINTDLEIIDPNPLPTHPGLLFSSNLLLSQIGNFDYLIYDTDDLDNITVVGSGNISAAHNFSMLHEGVYQDTILIFNDLREISFWDVSDLNNWQFEQYFFFIDDSLRMSSPRFFIMEHYLLYLNPYNLVAIDMNDYSIQQISVAGEYLCVGIDAATWENNVYFTTREAGIQRFGYEDNQFQYLGKTGEHGSNISIYLNESYAYIRDIDITEGLRVYNLSDPTNIIELPRLFEGEHKTPVSRSGELINSLLIVRDMSDSIGDIEVYDFSDPHNPQLRNTIDMSLWSGHYLIPRHYEAEPNALYVIPWHQNVLLKYNISQENDNELLAEFDITPFWSDPMLISDGYLYILSRMGNSNWHKLSIFSGLDSEELVLENTINNFAHHSIPELRMVGDYLTVCVGISSGNFNTYFYSLSDPLNPELIFQTSLPGIPFINDDLLFQSPGSAVYVFDLSNEPSGTIQPFSWFLHSQRSDLIFFREHNNQDYLFAGSYATSIGVFEYSYEVSVEDDAIELPAGTSLFQNYPNPFNPETKIEFYLEKWGEVKLEIFNIRGQRLAVLVNEELEEGEHSVIWNPKTAKGKDLPSGVYLYRLQTGDYGRTRKMLFLK